MSLSSNINCCVPLWNQRGTLETFQAMYTKGLAKLGNIVAETLLRRQMFPSLAARETYVAATNFAARKQKMFLPEVKNIFVSDTNFASETNVSQFSHDENNVD